jgi:hypothetical protein
MRDRKPCGARALHAIFSDIYGTAALYVTADRVHFKPPQHTAYPAWADPGDVHYGLHWDVDTRRASWPVPYSVQGVRGLTRLEREHILASHCMARGTAARAQMVTCAHERTIICARDAC